MVKEVIFQECGKGSVRRWESRQDRGNRATMCYCDLMPAKRSIRAPKSPSLTLGLAGFTKISAVEGVRLTTESQQMFAEFDRQGLDAEQRRRAIAEKHAEKA